MLSQIFPLFKCLKWFRRRESHPHFFYPSVGIPRHAQFVLFYTFSREKIHSWYVCRLKDIVLPRWNLKKSIKSHLRCYSFAFPTSTALSLCSYNHAMRLHIRFHWTSCIANNKKTHQDTNKVYIFSFLCCSVACCWLFGLDSEGKYHLIL